MARASGDLVQQLSFAAGGGSSVRSALATQHGLQAGSDPRAVVVELGARATAGTRGRVAGQGSHAARRAVANGLAREPRTGPVIVAFAAIIHLSNTLG